MQVGDIVAANIEGVCFKKNAIAEVLKLCGGAMPNVAIVRFIDGWDFCRNQLVTIQNFRVIPRS